MNYWLKHKLNNLLIFLYLKHNFNNFNYVIENIKIAYILRQILIFKIFKLL